VPPPPLAPSRCPTTGTYPALVTAAVDAISLRYPLQIGRDAVMRGQVVWTGRTALDIRMELLQVGGAAGGGATAAACQDTPAHVELSSLAVNAQYQQGTGSQQQCVCSGRQHAGCCDGSA
jgi:acyl-CoA hydrolase